MGDEILLHSYGSYGPPAGIRLERLDGNRLVPAVQRGAFDGLERRGLSMVAGPNDTVLVAGSTMDSVPYLARLAAEDGTWNLEWSLQQFDAVEGEASIGAAAGLEDGSSIFVALANDSLVTGRLDSEQQPVWTQPLDLLRCCDDTQVRVAVDPENRVFVLGRAPGQDSATRLLALSGCDGEVLWTWDLGNEPSLGATVTIADGRLFTAGSVIQRFGDTRAWVAELELGPR